MSKDKSRAVARIAAREIPSDPADIFKALNAARVQYMVVGGIAAIGYGVPRHTFDVDVAVRLEAPNLQRFKRVMTRLDFVTRVPADVVRLAEAQQRRTWTRQEGMQVFSYIERRPPFRVVDVMVKSFRDFARLHRRRVTVRYGGVRIPLAHGDIDSDEDRHQTITRPGGRRLFAGCAAPEARQEGCMTRRLEALTPDKRVLIEQFLKLSPAQRLRYAFGMARFVAGLQAACRRLRR